MDDIEEKIEIEIEAVKKLFDGYKDEKNNHYKVMFVYAMCNGASNIVKYCEELKKRTK